jgi:hypothetical protein
LGAESGEPARAHNSTTKKEETMKPEFAELETLMGRFRAAEAEIATTFFAAPRPLAQQEHWLRFQIAREARNLEEIADHQRCRMVEEIEDGLPREALVEQFHEDYQEIRHYAMLAYLFEALTGEEVRWRAARDSARAAPWYAHSRAEHARWAHYRENGTVVEHAAALFTRGGGGALFYGLARIAGGDYERLLAEASQVILADEIEHGASEGRDELYKVIETADDIAVARRIIEEMCLLRLEMRNRQFAGVMTPERQAEIVAGGIDPVSTDEMLRVCDGGSDWFAAFHAAARPLSMTSVQA